MKKGYIENKALVNEWLTDTDFQGNVKEDLLQRWVDRRVEAIIDTQQLKFRPVLLNVKDFQARLPPGFHSAHLVAGTDDFTKCMNREELLGMSQQIYGTDCDIDISISCPKCNPEECTCGSKSISINVDELYLRERPYLWEMTNSKYLGYSAVVTDGYPCANFNRDFHIMKPRSSNAALWNTEYFLGVCSAIGDVCKYTYDIEPPYLLTNMKEGQIYMACLKYEKDEEGFFLIPNFVEVVEAVTAYLTEMMAFREWSKDRTQNNRLFWLDAKRDSDLKLGQAKVKLEQPDADVWKEITDKHWSIDRGRYHY